MIPARGTLSHGGLRKGNPDSQVMTGFYRSPGIADQAAVVQRARGVRGLGKGRHDAGHLVAQGRPPAGDLIGRERVRWPCILLLIGLLIEDPPLQIGIDIVFGCNGFSDVSENAGLVGSVGWGWDTGDLLHGPASTGPWRVVRRMPGR